MDERSVRALRGELTDIEERAFTNSLDESPERRSAHAELQAAWDVAGLVETDEAPSDIPTAPSLETIVATAEERRATAAAPVRFPITRSPIAWVGLAAAAALVAVFTLPEGTPFSESLTPLLSPIESVASGSDVVTMTLSEGSVIRMAGGASVEFPPSAEEREVLLDGRAFFAVAEGEAPFVVRTDLGEVTVLGTRFEVSAAADELRLLVIEGVVTLSGDGGTMEVSAGDVAYLPRSTGTPRRSDEDPWALLDWPVGLLVFQDTPLSAVARELERHFERRVELPVELRDLRVTAWFGDEPVEEVVSALCLIAGTTCVVEDDRIDISR